MGDRLTRRGLLAGGFGAALAGAALPLWAEAPVTSPFPRLRMGTAAAPGEEIARLIRAANLGGQTGLILADARTGAVLEDFGADLPLPPASTAKTITALYALERLGAAHRFATRILATGPLVKDRIEGDLILAGGGDPTLDTDDLGDMAAALRAAGVRSVAGRYLAFGGALPDLPRIAADQPDQVGYNPGLSGLMLNFGRVYFEWKKTGDGYAISMDARGERFAPKIDLTRMELAPRAAPLFTYRLRDGTEDWTVAETALGKEGSRWLPVRRAAPYVAEAFRALAAAQGIALPRAVPLVTLPTSFRELARHESEPLDAVLRGMLRWSTNITAEAVGLAASGAGTLRGSARAMSDWAMRHLSHPGDFVDHSGLGAATRVTARGMMQALRLGQSHASGHNLTTILRDMGMRDAEGRAVENHPVRVRAKTGTLNFVSGLTGFIQPPQGHELAFAIFSADPARRAALPMADREAPPGGEAWLKRARKLQGQLLHRWGERFV